VSPLLLLFLLIAALFAAALGVAVRQHVKAIEERLAEERAAHAKTAALDEHWRPYADLGPLVVGISDFREAGWSEVRARRFLADRFPDRDTVSVADLKPFLADVTVRDVLRYRRMRRDAADRYEPIRQTWINVEDLEREGRLPAEIRPLVRERERQSGRLVKATDLLPFVGRPVVVELLEEKLADCGVTPPPARDRGR
jgi:hypothetical protein